MFVLDVKGARVHDITSESMRMLVPAVSGLGAATVSVAFALEVWVLKPLSRSTATSGWLTASREIIAI